MRLCGAPRVDIEGFTREQKEFRMRFKYILFETVRKVWRSLPQTARFDPCLHSRSSQRKGNVRAYGRSVRRAIYFEYVAATYEFSIHIEY